MAAQTAILISFAIVAAVVTGMGLLRLTDTRLENRVWSALAAKAKDEPQRFDPAMLADLPEPARRYLAQAIAPGTPLRHVAVIEMAGSFDLGSAEAPNGAPMVAEQILAGPAGFVWKMRSGPVSGSDGLGPEGSWTRFRLFGLLPVARNGFDEDHRRSAFARAVAEAAFWSPASVLPGPGIRWEAAGPDTARLTVTQDGLTQSVDLTLDAGGQPRSMVMPRWSNANPDKIWQIQPFGAEFGAMADFGGYHLPVEVDAGNFFGTPAWFAFFRARVTAISFLP